MGGPAVSDAGYPYGEFNATKWAAEFKRLFPDSDADLMLGWFANAIMTGYDLGMARGEREHAPIASTYDPHDSQETRYTDAVTGGQKGAKLTMLGAIDPLALIELARVGGYGAEKYAAFNYLKGYDWALSMNAAMRHALLFWNGENVDTESGRLHVAMAAWHFLALTSFLLRGLGTDTRFVAPSAAPQPDNT